MALADLLTTTFTHAIGDKPRDDELDVFGVTHPGKVRKQNQDHFLFATVNPLVVIHGTSLPDRKNLPLQGQRFASLMLVADGVGSGEGGTASQLATESIARYVSSTMTCFHSSARGSEREFYDALTTAALQAHDAVRAVALTRPEVRSMATTLTVALFYWPWAYILQVGDSRFYHYWNGELKQVTRDQTIAQDLIDKGVLPKERAADSPFTHVLASAIGGREGASPVVTRLDIRPRGRVMLLCSDGLTKHVTDEQIAEQLEKMESSEQVCRKLLDMALEGGGSDNVTILIGRATRDGG